MKLAVIFPGVGYHTDKPLLYYSKKIAKDLGFEIIEVSYGGFESGIRGDHDKMKSAYLSAQTQVEEILKNVSFSDYDKILFISKSIGTAVAGAYAVNHKLNTYNVYYTPVEQSFDVMKNPGIVFSGSDDPWISHDIFLNKLKEIEYPYHIVEKSNHSLETGDVDKDIDNLKIIMDMTKKYIEEII